MWYKNIRFQYFFQLSVFVDLVNLDSLTHQNVKVINDYVTRKKNNFNLLVLTLKSDSNTL